MFGLSRSLYKRVKFFDNFCPGSFSIFSVSSITTVSKETILARFQKISLFFCHVHFFGAWLFQLNLSCNIDI